jgi:trehalose synthase
MAIQEVHVEPRPLDAFQTVQVSISPEWTKPRSNGNSAPRIWHINSTAVGGGVAEMLPSLIGYGRTLDVDMRWLVLNGTADFFAVTKRLHHALHGSTGDGRELGRDERGIYQRALEPVAAALESHLGAGDAVMLHDPQTAGLAPTLVDAGHPVVWRCHIGHDATNSQVEQGWRFLQPYLDGVNSYVFSRPAYVPEMLSPDRAVIVPPSIDPGSPKNEELDAETIRTVLVQAGLIAGRRQAKGVTVRTRNGNERRILRQAKVIAEDELPSWETPLAIQVSRWDPLKDFAGVMRGFVSLAASGEVPRNARLMLVGPQVDGVSDDPEAADVFAEVEREWRALPREIRAQIYLVQLPTADVVENATVVNALQRHAAVVIQKSLHEGFGLTVTEAMWKARPVLASCVGGIQDQITHGVDGLLLPDPRDTGAFAAALHSLLDDPARAGGLGEQARQTVADRFLTLRHLYQYTELFSSLRVSPAA